MKNLDVFGPVAYPPKPEGTGGSDVVPLNGLGLDRIGAEPFPANVSAQQGAGSSSNSLAPAPGEPTSGSVFNRGAGYVQSREAVTDGRPLLSPGPARPEGGVDTQPGETADDGGIGQGQYGENSSGAGLNPLLGKTPTRFKGV